MNSQRTLTWLKIGSAIVIGFGLLTALSSLPAGSVVLRHFLDLAFWPFDGAQTVSGSEIALVTAILGGITTGWGVIFWQVSTRLYPRDPELARSLILSSIGTWFIIDGIGSVAVGAPVNALYNVGFLALFVLPLWRPVRTAEGV